jgi:hypothetical protein
MRKSMCTYIEDAMLKIHCRDMRESMSIERMPCSRYMVRNRRCSELYSEIYVIEIN